MKAITMNTRIWLPAAAAALLSLSALAKVSPDEAARLGKELTPVGAERAANKDGSIPAWDGGLTQSPPCYKGKGTRYCDPFPGDKPLQVISKSNLAQYKDKLTPGQLAMFDAYPDTYKMRVFQSRRSAAYPDFVNEATAKNAVNGSLISNGEGIDGAILGFPFPIPKNGQEVIWNHKLGYIGPGLTHWNEQAAVTTSGDFNLVKLREDIKFNYGTRGMTPDKLDNVGIYFLQVVMEPPRLAGQITLVHETMDQVKEVRRAWQYNPGQRRLKRAPNIGYDNPAIGSDGLRTNDQYGMYNGATDRYTWKLLGKREAYIPYNAYEIHSDKYKVKDIVRKGHINPELARFEPHRVWVVEADLKQGTSHLYAKRVFYVDEDSWHVVLVDNYDRRGLLWRFQESHTIQAYDQGVSTTALDSVYDLQSRRYIILQMSNEDPEGVQKDFPATYFDPTNVQKQATK